jgi:hypothetical protein
VIVLVMFVRLSLTVLPFKLLRLLLARMNQPRRWWPAARSPEQTSWIVKTAARFVPGATCLTRAMVMESLYAFRGEDASTCFGVSRHGSVLEAHAWVEARGKVVFGAPEAEKFTPLVRNR